MSQMGAGHSYGKSLLVPRGPNIQQDVCSAFSMVGSFFRFHRFFPYLCPPQMVISVLGRVQSSNRCPIWPPTPSEWLAAKSMLISKATLDVCAVELATLCNVLVPNCHRVRGEHVSSAPLSTTQPSSAFLLLAKLVSCEMTASARREVLFSTRDLFINRPKPSQHAMARIRGACCST